MRKFLKIIIPCFIIIALGIGSWAWYKQAEKNKQLIHEKEVRDYYHSSMKTKKDTSLLKKKDGAWVDFGIVFQDTLELEEINGDYYRIKDTDYYVFYQDLLLHQKDILSMRPPYLLWNDDVVTTSPVTIYQEGNKKIKLQKSIQAPILRKGEDFYTVILNDKLYEIKKEDVQEVKTGNSEVEKTLKKLVFYILKKIKI